MIGHLFAFAAGFGAAILAGVVAMAGAMSAAEEASRAAEDDYLRGAYEPVRLSDADVRAIERTGRLEVEA